MPRFNLTIQEASPLLSYTDGIWWEGSPTNDSETTAYDGSFKTTNTDKAKAKFKFAGTGVSIFGAFRLNHGDFSVVLDDSGVPFTSSSNGLEFKVELWNAYNLKNTVHAVVVTNIHTAPDRTDLDLDYITIEREIGEEGDSVSDSIIDDTSTNVQYQGNWGPDTTMASQNHNSTIHSTTETSSHVKITFQGCCIEIYGLYTNAAYTVNVDDQPAVAMQGPDTDLPGDLWHPQTLLFLKDGLSEDTNHTVTLMTTNTNQMRPFSFDYAVVKSAKNTTSTVSSNRTKPHLSQNARSGLIVSILMLLILAIIACFLVRRRRLRAWKKLEPHAYDIHMDRMVLIENSESSSAPTPDSRLAEGPLSDPPVSQSQHVADDQVALEAAVPSPPPPPYHFTWNSRKILRR